MAVHEIWNAAFQRPCRAVAHGSDDGRVCTGYRYAGLCEEPEEPHRFTLAIQHEAMAHYADHCAVCHANNGSGQSMFGKGMYPKAPDLRGQTQTMSDGEIFYDIENGIRMSGMPAFGGDGTADETWKLVSFVRHLPHLTPAEETEMEALAPKTPGEAAEEKQEDQFLNGDSTPTAAIPHLKGHSR